MRNNLITTMILAISASACGTIIKEESAAKRSSENSANLTLAENERALAFTLPEEFLSDGYEGSLEGDLIDRPENNRFSIVCADQVVYTNHDDLKSDRETIAGLTSPELDETAPQIAPDHSPDIAPGYYALLDLALETIDDDVASIERTTLYYNCRGKAHLVVRDIKSSATYKLSAVAHRGSLVYKGTTKFSGKDNTIQLVLKKVSRTDGDKWIDIIFEDDGITPPPRPCAIPMYSCPDIYKPVKCSATFKLASGRSETQTWFAANECEGKLKVYSLQCDLQAESHSAVICSPSETDA